MLEVKVEVGRFIGVVGSGRITLAEFATLRTSFTQALARVNRRCVLVVDARDVGVLSPDVEAALGRLMQMDASLVERAAYFVRDTTAARPQLEAIATAAKNPARIVLHTRKAVDAHLLPVLDAAEQRALAAMLGA